MQTVQWILFVLVITAQPAPPPQDRMILTFTGVFDTEEACAEGLDKAKNEMTPRNLALLDTTARGSIGSCQPIELAATGEDT